MAPKVAIASTTTSTYSDDGTGYVLLTVDIQSTSYQGNCNYVVNFSVEIRNYSGSSKTGELNIDGFVNSFDPALPSYVTRFNAFTQTITVGNGNQWTKYYSTTITTASPWLSAPAVSTSVKAAWHISGYDPDPSAKDTKNL
jgi:hypothetical protein